MRSLVTVVACLAGCFDFDALDRFPPDAPIGATNPVLFDTAEAPDSLCSGSPCSHVHRVGSGADGIIVIWYYCASSPVSAQTVTRNGVPAQYAGAANYMLQRGELWYALASPSADHLISVTHNCSEAYVASMSATNVDQAAPIRATTFYGTDEITIGIANTVDSAPNDLVMDGVCTGTGVANAPEPQRVAYIENITSSYPCGAFAGSTQPGASPSVSTTWTATTMDLWVLIGVSLKPTGSL